MSAYKRIQTQFKNLDSLKKALVDVGFDHFEVAANPQANDLVLHGYSASHGGDAALRIPKDHYNAFEDTGFAWDPESKTYRAIISTHDGGFTVGEARYANFGEGTLTKVRQRYAYHEVCRQARMKGYGVRQVDDQSGAIRLQLVKL